MDPHAVHLKRGRRGLALSDCAPDTVKRTKRPDPVETPTRQIPSPVMVGKLPTGKDLEDLRAVVFAVAVEQGVLPYDSAGAMAVDVYDRKVAFTVNDSAMLFVFLDDKDFDDQSLAMRMVRTAHAEKMFLLSTHEGVLTWKEREHHWMITPMAFRGDDLEGVESGKANGFINGFYCHLAATYLVDAQKVINLSRMVLVRSGGALVASNYTVEDAVFGQYKQATFLRNFGHFVRAAVAYNIRHLKLNVNLGDGNLIEFCEGDNIRDPEGRITLFAYRSMECKPTMRYREALMEALHVTNTSLDCRDSAFVAYATFVFCVLYRRGHIRKIPKMTKDVERVFHGMLDKAEFLNLKHLVRDA